VQTYKTYLRIPFVLVVARSTSKGIFVFKITMEKKCTKCKEVKSLDEFYNNKNYKDGKTFMCIVCVTKIVKDKRAIKIKQNLEYRETNKDRIKEYEKEYQKSLYKNRIKTDPLLKLTIRIRSLIFTSIKNKGYSKKTRTYNILKCKYCFLMQWLNGIASNGYAFGTGDLHIDHVIPVSWAQTEEELYLLNHYSNFQLLTSFENLSKNNRYVNPVNLARVLEHHPNPDKIREIHARL
jgi:glutaredoxin